METTIDLPSFTRTGAISVNSATDHEVGIIWTTGAAVRRKNSETGEVYDEVLDLAPSAVRLDRLNSSAPFLRSHAANSLDGVIGVVIPGSARIENGQGRAMIRLSRRKDVAGLVQDIRDGIIRAVSVGYRVHRFEKTPSKDGRPAQMRAVDWSPMEVSAVAVPADPGARVRSDERHLPSFPCDVEVRSAPESPTYQPQTKEVSMNAPYIRLGVEDHEKRAVAISEALLHRADPGQFAATPAGRNYIGMTLAEIASECLAARGIDVRRLSKSEIVARSLDPAMAARSGGGMSTGDFPSILADVTNKILRAGYEYAGQTWRPFTRVVEAADFREMTRTSLSETPPLERVVEGGEYERGSMTDAAEKYSIGTFGRIIGITRQALIDDDLHAFSRLSWAIGVQAAQLESDVVWSQILSNPTMTSDGIALFDPAHGNLAASGSSINVVSVGAGRSAMHLQRGLDGATTLAVDPAFIIVPPSLRTAAEQFTGKIRPEIAAAVVPESLRKLEIICEQRLDNGIAARKGIPGAIGSATTWYMAAAPGLVDIVEIAHLQGFPGVWTETRMGFDVDGVEIKARLDVGAKAIDWRGLYRNPGA